jgi:hypothetical protein
MHGVGKTLCPSCAMEIVPDAAFCGHCGEDLSTVRPEQNKYQLVRDGQKFGIALRGRMVLPDMSLKEAQRTLAILNSDAAK